MQTRTLIAIIWLIATIQVQAFIVTSNAFWIFQFTNSDSSALVPCWMQQNGSYSTVGHYIEVPTNSAPLWWTRFHAVVQLTTIGGEAANISNASLVILLISEARYAEADPLGGVAPTELFAHINTPIGQKVVVSQLAQVLTPLGTGVNRYLVDVPLNEQVRTLPPGKYRLVPLITSWGSGSFLAHIERVRGRPSYSMFAPRFSEVGFPADQRIGSNGQHLDLPDQRGSNPILSSGPAPYVAMGLQVQPHTDAFSMLLERPVMQIEPRYTSNGFRAFLSWTYGTPSNYWLYGMTNFSQYAEGVPLNPRLNGIELDPQGIIAKQFGATNDPIPFAFFRIDRAGLAPVPGQSAAPAFREIRKIDE